MARARRSGGVADRGVGSHLKITFISHPAVIKAQMLNFNQITNFFFLLLLFFFLCDSPSFHVTSFSYVVGEELVSVFFFAQILLYYFQFYHNGVPLIQITFSFSGAPLCVGGYFFFFFFTTTSE